MLELRHITKTFPGVKALDDVSFGINPAEIHALCGENGAGKSTLLNILTGNIQPDSGQMLINNHEVRIDGPAQATRLGIAIVYQQLSLVDNLSVAENIFANRQPRNRFGLIRYRTLFADTQALLTQLNLPDLRPEAAVATLSPGQKQLVEIAKALSQNPDILLLDEPTASLTERETQTLFKLVRQLRAQGKAIIYISHRLTEIFTLADRVSVLKDGRHQTTLPIDRLTPDQLIRLMVGRDLANVDVESQVTDEVLLTVDGLSGERFRDVSFQLHRGEILGLAGLVGAGRTEIARAIFGIDARTAGLVTLKGRQVDIRHPADAVELGIGYVPEDRKTQGLFLEQSVAQNIVAVKPPANGPWFSVGRVASVAEHYRQTLGIRTASVQERVQNLSGGNQQKALLARWLLTDPDVLLVDEPTHGIDVGAKAEIYELLRQLARQGKGILLISSELPELLLLADRILVIREGQLSGALDRSQATEEQIMNLATT
ncbi:sugar ABC transporter ATP-binding protein [Spirosoma soli]|uniref:Sugar ABC transporter ATP-binding protein n=1 Tax=Spirosoma soli TaxID=1770529 RepID=A0ABW5MBW0_9BACT